MAVLNKTRGSSPTAYYIAERNQDASQHFRESAVFGKQSVYSELIELFDECKYPDWDGHDAFPVQETTFNNVWAVIDALPLGFPLPSFNAEPDGNITLEWYRHPRWILSISISPDKELFFAALFGNSSIKGSEIFFGDIPTTILNLIQRVNIQTV